MTTYRFAITGLRHHDFANRLDELYDKAMGKRMSISIEHDNPGEMDAVIVYWGRCFVGYVRSGTDREKACSLILSSGRGGDVWQDCGGGSRSQGAVDGDCHRCQQY